MFKANCVGLGLICNENETPEDKQSIRLETSRLHGPALFGANTPTNIFFFVEV